MKKIQNKMNKIVWLKLKKYFKNKTNNTSVLINSMLFKIKAIIICNIEQADLIRFADKLNTINNNALEYCLLKAARK